MSKNTRSSDPTSGPQHTRQGTEFNQQSKAHSRPETQACSRPMNKTNRMVEESYVNFDEENVIAIDAYIRNPEKTGGAGMNQHNVLVLDVFRFGKEGLGIGSHTHSERTDQTSEIKPTSGAQTQPKQYKYCGWRCNKCLTVCFIETDIDIPLCLECGSHGHISMYKSRKALNACADSNLKNDRGIIYVV